MLEIKLITREELDKSLDLVWQVFCEYEAANYAEDSKQAFYDAIHSKDYLDMFKFLYGKTIKEGTLQDKYTALASVIRNYISRTWVNSNNKWDAHTLNA